MLALVLGMSAGPAEAGGGVVLSEDQCIMTIGVYEAHFTAFQPDTRGNTQFCEDLPDTGTTLFTLDYLHASLREVPVDFRVIRNVTGQGPFAREEHIDEIPDLQAVTVAYQPPVVRPGGNLTVDVIFDQPGEYVGIVTAGHPTRDIQFRSVFPFAVARWQFPWSLALPVLLVLGGVGYLAWRRRAGAIADDR